MTTKQKRAIYYSIRRRQLARQKDYIDTHNLQEEFKQSSYKTMTLFLKSKGVNIY